MFSELVRLAGNTLGGLTDRLRRFGKRHEVWIDVGSHLGERTFDVARSRPWVTVFAFEPNLAVATRRMGRLSNFIVLPMAVTETDGHTSFYLNEYDAASSVLPFNEGGRKDWIRGTELVVTRVTTVPSIRLDTFMSAVGVGTVDYLKIDAQGADFMVIKSAGARLTDVMKLELEVQITPTELYTGAGSKGDVVDYLRRAGFVLHDTVRQSFDQEENLTFFRTAPRPRPPAPPVGQPSLGVGRAGGG